MKVPISSVWMVHIAIYFYISSLSLCLVPILQFMIKRVCGVLSRSSWYNVLLEFPWISTSRLSIIHTELICSQTTPLVADSSLSSLEVLFLADCDFFQTCSLCVLPFSSIFVLRVLSFWRWRTHLGPPLVEGEQTFPWGHGRHVRLQT